jgi:hypothetical protein
MTDAAVFRDLGSSVELKVRPIVRLRGEEIVRVLFFTLSASFLIAKVVLAQVHDDCLCRPTLAPRATGPQIADDDFTPSLPPAAFVAGQGPTVVLDEAHFNFHTVDGRYSPFVRILRRDGFVVEPGRSRFSRSALARSKILVIANAMAERNKDGDWTLPTPSPFGRDEIEAVREWVAGGGSLFLIADHMPFGGAAADLASSFGIFLTNGYATDRTCSADEFVFQRSDRTLGDHPITRGRNANERIDFVRTFTGQAFRIVGQSTPLLILTPETVLLFPSEAWKFSEATPRMAAHGMLQERHYHMVAAG